MASITPPAQLSQNQVIISSKKDSESKDQMINEIQTDKTPSPEDKKPEEQVKSKSEEKPHEEKAQAPKQSAQTPMSTQNQAMAQQQMMQ